MTMEVVRATTDDVDVVRALLAEVSAWLIERGLRQWPEVFPDEWFVPALEEGCTWLARRDDELVGTITLQWEDEAVWGARPPDAGYVHRLAVRRHATGVGRQLLDWADAEVLAHGRQFLRLDCWRDNERLRAYYAGAGFEHRGDGDEWGWPVACFERRVSGARSSPE